MSKCKCRLCNKLNVHVCFPQHQEEGVVVIHTGLLSSAWQAVYLSLCFQAVFNIIQDSCISSITGKTKLAFRYVSCPMLFCSSAVPAALVHLVPRDQSMQLRICFLFWNVTTDSVIYPFEHIPLRTFTNHWCTFNPNNSMVVRCSTCLILFLEEIMGDITQNLSLENDSLEESMKFQGKFP